MDKRNWYYKQVVSQSDLDESFDWVEEADLDIVKDLELYGAISGLAISEQATPSMSVDVGLGVAYGKSGERIYSSSNSVADCSQDEYGTTTTVGTSLNERWLSVYIRFLRSEESPETDGNSLEVYTKQIEGAEIFVRQGTEASILGGSATPPALLSNAILLADIKLEYGQVSITTSDLDFSRREDFVRLSPSNYPSFAFGTAKDAIAELVDMVDNLSGGGGISFSPTSTWLGGITLHGPSQPVTSISEAIDAIVYDLAQFSAASKIGISGYATSNDRYTFSDNSLQYIIEQLAGRCDLHAEGSTNKHDADDVVFADTATVALGYSSSTQVQAAIDNIATTLKATTGVSGGDQIGIEAVAGSPESLAGGTLQAAISAIYGHLNDRIDSTENETISGDWVHTGRTEFRNHVTGKHIVPSTYAGNMSYENFAKKLFGAGDVFGAPSQLENYVMLSGSSVHMVGPVITTGVAAGEPQHYVTCLDDQLSAIYHVDPYDMTVSTISVGSISAGTGTIDKCTAICSDGSNIYACLKITGDNDQIVRIHAQLGTVTQADHDLADAFSDYGSDEICLTDSGAYVAILCNKITSSTSGVISSRNAANLTSNWAGALTFSGSFDTHLSGLQGMAYSPNTGRLAIGIPYTAGEESMIAMVSSTSGSTISVIDITASTTSSDGDAVDICWDGNAFWWVTRGGATHGPRIGMHRPAFGNFLDELSYGSTAITSLKVPNARGGACCFDGSNVWFSSFGIGTEHSLVMSPVPCFGTPSLMITTTEKIGGLVIFDKTVASDWAPLGPITGQIKYGKMCSDGQHVYALHADPGDPPTNRKYLYRISMSAFRGGGFMQP